jgi:myo-inositol-1(or 4)-monophosphatase
MPQPLSLDPNGALSRGVQEAVLAAGAFIRYEARRFDRGLVEFKGRNDLVSYVDRQAEQILSDNLAKLVHGSGFIMEESGYDRHEQEYVWIVDPLDGTTNFVYGVPFYSVSVALQHNKQTILGAVYEVNREELFLAARGHGAMLNGAPIKVSDSPGLADSLIATGFPFRAFARIDEYLSMLKDCMHRARGVRRLGSAALDLAYTAMGRFDGFFEINLSPWDVAAGTLIIQEAGGTVTDFFGEDNHLFGKMIVATNGRIHAEMLSVIQQYAKRN